ncbi:MAG: hypothetical protein ACAF42_04530 [Limnothrix sp. BL-A-16]
MFLPFALQSHSSPPRIITDCPRSPLITTAIGSQILQNPGTAPLEMNQRLE